jgi:hypothetical protein
MSVQFTIRGKDILQLRSALLRLGHPEPDKCWIIFLEVTPVMASFRFGETTVQYPVDGKSPGFARFSEELSAARPELSQSANLSERSLSESVKGAYGATTVMYARRCKTRPQCAA